MLPWEVGTPAIPPSRSKNRGALWAKRASGFAGIFWLLWCLTLLPGAAQTNINLTAGALEIHLTWGGIPWSTFGAAGSIQLVESGGAFNATLSESVTVLTRLPATNTTVFIRYGGDSGGLGRSLVRSRGVVITAGTTNRLDLDLCSALSLVKGTFTLNGGPPPPFRLVQLSDAEGNLWVGARTDETGAFKAFLPAGDGKGQVILVPGQGAFSFTAPGCQQVDLGTIALTSATLKVNLTYLGASVASQKAGGSVAISATDLFGRLIGFDTGTVELGNLAASTVTFRVGYGSVAFEPGVPDLVAPQSATLVSGSTREVSVELGSAVGLLQARVLLNGSPAPQGTRVSLLAADGRSIADALTDSEGKIRILAPAGSGRGQIHLVEGQGAFSYVVRAGQTTDLGDFRLGSGAIRILLSYHGSAISSLQANTAILVRAAGILTNVLSEDSTVIGNLPPAAGLLRIGYGGAIAATESDFLPSTTAIPITVVPGITNVIRLDLCGPLGLIQGKVLLNNLPVPRGTPVSLADFSGHGYVTAATDAAGVFRALVPSGPGKGQVIAIAGQGSFSFHVVACETTELNGIGQNQIPLMDPVSSQSVLAGTPLQFVAHGHDTDSPAPLTYSLEPGAPEGATLDANSGVFRWLPSLSEGGKSYRVLVTGTDAGNPPSSDTVAVTIDVRPHRPPLVALTTPSDQDVLTAPALVSVRAQATPLDSPSITQVEFYVDGQPLGVSTAPPYGASWVAPAVGDYSLRAVATDLAGVRGTSAPVRVSIVRLVNRPPVFDPVSPSSPLEGREFSVGVHATDPDPGQTVSFALDASAPTGARLLLVDPTHAIITWTPPPGSGGRTTDITVLASDNGNPPQTTSLRIPVLVTHSVPPTVVLSSPTPETTAVAPASFPLRASVTVGTDVIQKVEFFADETQIASLQASPYEASWSQVGVGSYRLTARATDLSGVVVTSPPVRVTVTAAKPPASIRLTQPIAGGTAFSPAPVRFAASFSNLDSTVSRVEYLANGTVVASSDAAPYTAEWLAIDAGNYLLTARARLEGGATLVSPALSYTVGGHRAEVALVTSGDNLESTSIQQALTASHHSVDVLSSSHLGPDSLFGYRLAIWTDGGDPLAVVSEVMVDAFERAVSRGTSVYFIGERLVASAAGLDAAVRARWFSLLRVQPTALGPATGGDLTFEKPSTDHPLLRARSGLVDDFSYGGLLETVDVPAGDIEVAGQSRGRPILLMSPSSDSPEDPAHPNTVTQLFLRTRGGDVGAALSRDALFGNAIEWLIGVRCFSQVVRLETDYTPDPGSSGELFTLTLTVSAHGECGATGVEILQRIPASWTVVSSTPSRGSVSVANGVIGFTLGRLPLLLPETLTLRIRPSSGGLFTNVAQVHWNEEPNGVPLLSDSAYHVVGSAVPSVTLARRADGHLVLGTSVAPGVRLQVESSADLQQWKPLQAVEGGEQAVDLGVGPIGGAPLFLRARVVP